MQNEKILLIIITLGIVSVILAFSLICLKLLEIVNYQVKSSEDEKSNRYIGSINDLTSDEINSLKALLFNLGVTHNNKEKSQFSEVESESFDFEKMANDIAEDVLTIKSSKDISFSQQKDNTNKENIKPNSKEIEAPESSSSADLLAESDSSDNNKPLKKVS